MSSSPRPFVFVLHNHQPVGNFGHVFREAFDRCYRPVVDLVGQFPEVRVGLHFSGPLLEWLLREERAFLDQVKDMVTAGQVEILGGGFYEPILSVLPDHDASGQLEMMNMFCERYFGARPRGMWLAERVWDPDLPRLLAQEKLEYTLLDDTHFRAAGFDAQPMDGHYMTEKAGSAMAVFPIDKGLRYRIPFAAPDEVVEYIANAPGRGALTYGDDGEKFGLWPDTYEWVFEKKWLEKFFQALTVAQQAQRLEMKLPSDALASPASGRAYLPNASYEEMMEWALPVEGARRLHTLRDRLKDNGELDTYGPYVRGAIWQSFLTKYPEANRIHKKMLHVSHRLETAMEEVLRLRGPDIEGDLGDRLGTAQRELYRGQCCCAYWHGLFGGLYLNYLRSALYSSLVRAERIVDEVIQPEEAWLSYERIDVDLDGHEELLISNGQINLNLTPWRGGAAFELSLRPRDFNWTDVLTRREEAYHGDIHKASGGGDGADAPKSIHDMVRVKEEGLEQYVVYDDAERRTFVDRLLDVDVTLDGLRGAPGYDRGDFANEPYTVESFDVVRADKTSCVARLSRQGRVRWPQAETTLTIAKTFSVPIDGAAGTVEYTVKNTGAQAVEFRQGCELNLTLLAGSADDRYYEVDQDESRRAMSQAEHFGSATQIRLTDDYNKMRLVLTSGAGAALFVYPIETVSQSEGGLERTYQGTCLTFAPLVALEPGAEATFTLSFVFEVWDEA